MTLKEKFKKQLDTATPTLNRPYYQASQLAQIADEFAIGFTRWIQESPMIFNNGKSMEQALEIYKKEKGL